MNKLIVIASALVASASATAFADPAPAGPSAAPVTTAPQNHDWSDVSHINGQLVPVGQKHDYLLRYRRVNVSTNPIGWLTGFYGVSASYAISDNVAIRGDVNYFGGGVWDGTTGYEVGASMPIYLRRVYQGPFIEPGIIARGITSPSDGFDPSTGMSTSATTTTNRMVGPEMLAGYHWSFDSGLNVAMALGVARNLDTSSGQSSSDSLQPAGYFRVGYEF